MQDDFSEADNESIGFISISDLMSGLMIIFLLISIIFMFKVETQKQKNETIIAEINKISEQLKDIDFQVIFKLNHLVRKFDQNENIKVEQRRFDTIFYSPDFTFKTNKSSLRPELSSTISEFCVDLMETLAQVKSSVLEIRIEGHTDAGWGALSATESYQRNMQLSQARSQNVLIACLKGVSRTSNHKWFRNRLSASGRSSSQPLFDGNGKINDQKSRRIEFRIIANSAIKIRESVESLIAN